MQLQLATSPRFVTTGGRVVAIPERDAALLAWLALEGPTARARLAELLWPHSDPESARNALRQRLFQLRKSLGVDAVIGSATLALAEGLTHDLEDADGVLGDAAPVCDGEFAAWLARQRSRRRERMRESLAELAQMAEDACDWPDAASHARELLALEPQSEAAHRRVIRLHYLAGDRAAALQAFDRCEQMLKDDIGAAPSAETLALLATIEQSEAIGPRAKNSRLPGRVPAAMLRPPRLVGRDAAWSALDDAWDSGRMAVVIGEGGMGKTRLVSDFARARGRTLVISAWPGDERVVYASVSRLLRALPAEALRDIAAPMRRTLARLLPELGESAALSDREGRSRFFNAVCAVLHADTLAVDGFIFDDLHFADAASIELLQYVVAASPKRWIVTVRPGEVSTAGRALLDDWRAQDAVVPVMLAPFEVEHVAEIIDSLGVAALDDASTPATLLRHCGGNPLYLLETLKASLAQGEGALPGRLQIPASLHSLIERRIGHLSANAVRLARCAAVAAPDFSIELASEVLGLRTLDLADPIAELETAQVLCDGAFAHDLIYEAALASVPAPVARQLHAEIATFLELRGGEPARLAHHWAQANEWTQAGAAFITASERSRKASCLSEQCLLLAEAARCFERAGLTAERFDALLQRARALASDALGGDASAAVEAVEQDAATDEQRLLPLGARVELTMTR